MKKKVCVFIIVTILLYTQSLTGQNGVLETIPIDNDSSKVINNPLTFNTTALRFLNEAKTMLIQQQWDRASQMTQIGLKYDASIADLYYLQAVSLFEKGETKSLVIESLEKSLSSTVSWYEYNRDAARILLASLYVDVKKAQEALNILNESPILNTSDAMLTRAKALYVLEELGQAREALLEGANQYPDDRRFDELFYVQEYEHKIANDKRLEALDVDDAETVVIQNKTPVIMNEITYLSTLFNKRATQVFSSKSNAMLYAAIFSNLPDEKVRLLKAWNTQGETDPLYAIHALKENVITDEQAFEYMLPFFTNIDYKVLVDFLVLLNSEATIERARNYFRSYEGTLLFDFDGDLINEMIVHYERGRPSKIEYDENQDGELSWEMINDYGEPKTLELLDQDIFMNYETWPYVHTVYDHLPNKDAYIYYMVEDGLYFPMIDYAESDVFQNNLRLVFYTPVLHPQFVSIPTIDLFNASYAIDFSTSEYDESRARYTLIDGIIKSAVYTENSQPYAYGYYENGVLVTRNVDRDNNGTFEVVEVFASDDTKSVNSEKIKNDIFGFSHLAESQYIQKVYIDLDNDGFDDFSEEYIIQGGNISTWDNNGDGNWDIRYVQNEDKSVQAISYIHPLTGEEKLVQIENSIPIFANGKQLVKDELVDFYWIGENASSSVAEKIITELSLKQSTLVSLIVTEPLWNEEKETFMRVIGINNGDMYFGEVYYE